MKNPVNVEKLRKAFLDAKMPGAVALVDMFVESKRRRSEVTQIAPSCIDDSIAVGLAEIHDAVGKRFDFHPTFFHIGRVAAGVSPLEHLSMIIEVLDEVSPLARDKFDVLSGSLAESHRRVNRPFPRFSKAVRQTIILWKEKLGLHVSDDLALGRRGWWWPKRRRKPVDVHDLVRDLESSVTGPLNPNNG